MIGSSAHLVNPLACRQRWVLEEGTSKTASFRQEKSHSGYSKADGHPDQARTHSATWAVLPGRSSCQPHMRGGCAPGEDQEGQWGLSRGAEIADRRSRPEMP